VIREAFLTREIHAGPYADAAPELLIGYEKGFRHSWDCATGSVTKDVFTDNTQLVVGDHCVDPRLVPGVFWCDRAIATSDPALDRPRTDDPRPLRRPGAGLHAGPAAVRGGDAGRPRRNSRARPRSRCRA
jgi:hypothetical protein